jgi:hypothetical protein
MNSKTVKILIIAGVWCASSTAAYYIGLNRAPAASSEVASSKAGRNSAEHTTTITLGAMGPDGRPVSSLQDLLNAKGKPDADALKAWADSIDTAKAAAMLTDLQKLDPGPQRDAIIAALIASWATRDPDSYLTAHNDVTNPRTRETGVADALKAMAEKDPKAAIAWMQASTDAVPNQLLAQRYRSAIAGYAANDPQGALNFVNTLDTGSVANAQIKRQGLNTIADSLASDGNFTSALQMFSTLSDADRTTATTELINQWAVDSPKDAATYVTGITDPTQQAQMAGRLALSWGRTDPASAAAWAAQFDATNSAATGQPSGQILADAVRSWTRSDLAGPAAFLNTLTPSPDTDQAIQTFAVQARTVDPTTAMTWAGQISDPTMRDRATGAVAVAALAADPGNFTQFAASANLSPAQTQWLSQLPTDNPQALNRISNRVGRAMNNPNRPAPWNAAAPAGGAGGRGGAGG